MRTKEDYYDNLARITERFKGTELIPLREAADFLGVDPRSLQDCRDFPLKKVCRRYYVASVAFARWMSTSLEQKGA